MPASRIPCLSSKVCLLCLKCVEFTSRSVISCFDSTPSQHMQKSNRIRLLFGVAQHADAFSRMQHRVLLMEQKQAQRSLLQIRKISAWT